MRTLLFKVIDPNNDHEYKIFTDGYTEGFPAGAWVFNYFPLLPVPDRSLNASACPTKSDDPLWGDAAHATAP